MEDDFCQVLMCRTKEDTSGVNEDEANDSRCEGFFHQISPFLYFYIHYIESAPKALAHNVMTQYDICHQKKRAELGLKSYRPNQAKIGRRMMGRKTAGM